MASEKLEKIASLGANDEVVASYSRIYFQAFEKWSRVLWTALQDAKTAFPEHVAMAMKKTALADVANSKLQKKLGTMRCEFEYYQRKLKTKLDIANTFFVSSGTH